MKKTTRPKDQPKPRKPTKSQLDLLKLLYKFRFATTTLLATHRHKNPVTIYGTLQVLLKNDYIAKNYSPSYKLAGRGAEYYLTNTGIRYLRDNEQLSEAVLHAMYKNKHLGQPFIQRCLLIYQIYIHLLQQYGQDMKIYTRSEMQDAEGFPEQLPDLFITLGDHSYFLDIFTDNLFYLIKKRLDVLLKHYESGEWEEKTYPSLLIVLTDSRVETKTLAYIEKIKDDAFIEDGELNILTTTQKALLESTNKHVWSHNTSQALLSLTQD
jgi:DNA-binding PadR family transcriptional regulator